MPQATKADWGLLRQALTVAFKDESEEISFLSNDNAWRRSPGMSLREYKNGLITRMDKYQPGLRRIADEWERAAVRRFRAGLDNAILESHILMTCTGQRHTLQAAYEASCNWENTIQNLSSSNSAKNMSASLAGMLSIPQISALSNDQPHFSALSPQQEKNEKRFDSLETAVKKNELDFTEVKASITEVKETVKSLKEEMVQPRYFRPAYQRPLRPQFPVSRMPLSNPFPRQYYPQYTRPSGPRHQSVVPGLTGGPGYVTNQAPPVQRGQVGQGRGNVPSAQPQNGQMGKDRCGL